MKRLLILILLVSCISYLYTGCCTCKDTISTTSIMPYTVDYSSGGGFSGMHSGFIISPAGVVSYWSGMHDRKDDIRIVGTLSTDQLKALREHFDQSAFRTFIFNETGNMTTSLRITSNEEVHTVTWVGMRSETEHVPLQIKVLYTYLTELLAPIIIDMNKKDASK